MVSFQPKREAAIDEMVRALDQFQAEGHWKRSKKGNLWRPFHEMTVSVFKRRDNLFAWSIGDEEGVRFSPSQFETEQEAMYALAVALGVIPS